MVDLPLPQLLTDREPGLPTTDHDDRVPPAVQ
jgi:hypothetical protein